VQEHTATVGSMPAASVFLSPEVMTAESVGGVLPLHGRIHFTGPITEDFKFRVQLDDQLIDFTLSKQDCYAQKSGSSHCDYQFVLITFAFSPGAHRLSLCLPDTPSQPLTHTLTISNTSKLGQETTRAVHEYLNGQWIWR
jgi:hypothetical protein